MTHTKYINYVFAGLLIFSATACKKEKLQDINNSANSPLEVTPAVALPSSEVAIAYAIGGDMSRVTSILMQQVTGADRQMYSFNTYAFNEGDFDNLWRGGMYSGPMNNLHTQIAKCDAAGNKHYAGISKILMAYSVGCITDFWGDAPYSDAFKGANGMKPKYDTQQNLYATIQKLLSDGKADLSGAAGLIIPGSDDLIYGGSVAKWKKLSNGLSARYYIHLSKFDASASQKALDAINAGALASNADDAQVNFVASATGASPWSQYNDQRGDIIFDGFMLDNMLTLKDPRLPIYLDTTDFYKGKLWLGSYFGDQTSPVFYFTYSEQKFIEAEANNRLNNTAAAQAAFTAAITASMTKVGVSSADITTYLAANGTLTGTQAQMLTQIMFQKYLAMYLQPETWSDWRRTGVPAITKSAGAVISAIPRRLLYPQSERSYNGANTPAATLLTPKLWWDQ